MTTRARAALGFEGVRDIPLLFGFPTPSFPPSLPYTSPPLPLPIPWVLPSVQLVSLGSAIRSSSESGRSTTDKRFLM